MKTAKISVGQASPGMVVADSVYTFNNQMIIAEGTLLTDKVITRLKFYSIQQILINVQDDVPLPLTKAPLRQEFYLNKVKETKEFKDFNQSLLNTTNVLRNTLDGIVNNDNTVDITSIYHDINDIISIGRNGLHVFDMLHCMRTYNDLTYMHSVNVAILCNIFGRWLNFSQKDIEILTLCGLLHDIGKITIPDEILSKPSMLTTTEYGTIKTHALRGYNILKPLDINIHIKMSAMMHHERCDGSGYPMGLTSSQIDGFAKIVMICDVYDAMTSARVYRGPLCPFEVISIFELEGLTKYEPKYLMTFFDNINYLYLNCTVKLNNGSIGEIIFMNRNTMSKPVIKVGEEYIDLSASHNLYITEIL